MSFQAALETLNILFQEYTEKLTDEMERAELLGWVYQLRSHTRWYQVSIREHLDELYAGFRHSPVLTDYVMHTTSAFILTYGDSHSLETLTERVATGWSWTSVSCGCDREAQDRAPSKAWVLESMRSNNWLMLLYLHSHLPLPVPE